MLSLPPRFDLFRFGFPKEFIPEEIAIKYQKEINKNAAVITTPIDYLNESIQGISLPGISDIVIQQPQVSHNSTKPQNSTSKGNLGKLNIEPFHDNTYKSPSNPLSNITKEFKVTFRLNQGLMNYFMLYETAFYHICKPIDYSDGLDVFQVYVLNEEGIPTCKVVLQQLLVTGLDGLDFNYSKMERASETFDITFSFNNINFEYLENLDEY